jgi:hypothetical protein
VVLIHEVDEDIEYQGEDYPEGSPVYSLPHPDDMEFTMEHSQVQSQKAQD